MTPKRRMRSALVLILGDGCETFMHGECRRFGRQREARYGADKWCDACIAADALGVPADRKPLAFYRLRPWRGRHLRR